MSDSSVLHIVTDQILKVLESGIVPWQQPWTGFGGAHRNLARKNAYTGINTLILAASAWESSFTSPWWLTVNDAKSLGGRIRDDAWREPTCVVFYKERWFHAEREQWAKDQETRDPKALRAAGYQPRLILRYYKVYNLEQCEGVEAPQEETTMPGSFSPIKKAERIVAAMPDPPLIQFEGYKAYYSPRQDLVSIPPKVHFRSMEHFYATFFHELIHATGHEKRLKRDAMMGETQYASELYSKEELTAELGSAMLCLEAGITPDWENSAAYVNSWLKALQADRQWLLYGAAKAQAAVDYVLAN